MDVDSVKASFVLAAAGVRCFSFGSANCTRAGSCAFIDT
ncbi:hypothetical protein PAAG_12018 [Paracoccidioides lutzii Pb01]|uniref:Uncharacterized protein n=1 Tax=Paracoccidioides lutzii (strain ATCC MYA-826 / Pb01) TaxID=502779 RepID=A0A0A2VK39_PARBA|nr:hypothetical protein PAAG_12018 [Paracoccidioides lutzii Pb01]KGQ01249.1 hypothetical protein PAAG_12018 [Paracoccidioides lutzii Pb01]